MRGWLAGLVVLLTGCATAPTWYKAGATQESFNADKAFCEYEALKYGGSFDPNFGKSYAVSLHHKDIALACMRQKGYSQTMPTEQYSPQEPFTPVQVDLNAKGK
jgi:hypothetical protein